MDAEFLGAASLTMAPVSRVYEHLHDMGEFTMLILCDRASRRGVNKVDYRVEEGAVRDLLSRMALETRANILVLGKPVRSPGSNVFTTSDFEIFINKLKEQTGLEIVIVSPTPSTGTDNATLPDLLQE